MKLPLFKHFSAVGSSKPTLKDKYDIGEMSVRGGLYMTDLRVEKQRILEALWFSGKPAKPADLAKQLQMDFPSCMMHLLGLKKNGFVYCPEKGLYAITEQGKQALGFPKLGKDTAASLLKPVSIDKAFHFYASMGQYLGEYANSIPDFCEKLQKIDAHSIEFHMLRKDFENWFNGLGDIELAKRMGVIRETSLAGDELRKAVLDHVKTRCDELAGILRSI